MDFFDVYAKSGEAIARARRGEGPTLLECKTYRFAGHYVGDTLVYRNKSEADEWIEHRDPLRLFEARVTREGLVAGEDLRRIDREVVDRIAEAVSVAEAAPFPDPGDLLQDVYADA
jgi:pyruvate dehydrogenase E1 component alpha subunit